MDHKKIFLAPRSNEHAYAYSKSTIVSGVSYDQIKDHLDDKGKEILSKQPKIFAWGCVDKLKSRWDKIDNGDYVFFYVQGVFRYVGKVIYKQQSSDLSDALWPRKNNVPWSCVFFLEDIKEIYIPLDVINKLANYNLQKLQGFIMLNEKGIENIYDQFNSIEEFINTEFPRLQVQEDIKIAHADFNEIIKLGSRIKELEHQPHTLNYGRPIKIRDLILKAEDEWVLPDFQRYYDWGKNDVRDFLESIFYDYYVGSLLLWEIKDLPELGIINIKGVERTNQKPKEIILDGQQRITSLYYAIKTPEFNLKDTSSPVFFYIDFNSILHGNIDESIIKVLNNKYTDEETFEYLLFPFYRLDKYADWVSKFEDYLIDNKKLDSKEVRAIRRFIEQRVAHFWDGYEIPYISLPPTINLKSITDIFERINSKGKQLSVFDLLIARLLKYGVKLRKIWEDTYKKYPNIKRYYDKQEKVPILLFQAISLYYHKANSAKREDILNIFENIYKDNPNKDFYSDWNEFAKLMDQAIIKLEQVRSGFGVKSEKDIPFLPTLTELIVLLKEASIRENKTDVNKKIEMWYWSAIFSNAYSSAADSRLTLDFKYMKEWFDTDENVPKTISNARNEYKILNLKEIQSSSNAIYRGVLSLIGLQGAIDFNTGLTFESAKVNHKDHIFPYSVFKKYRYVNSILNMTWMSGDTNSNIKKAKKPSVYLKELRKTFSDEEFANVMKSHFISQQAIVAMESDDFEQFLNEREKTILEAIAEKIGLHYKEREYTQISPNTPFDNKRAIINIIQKCNEKIYWVDKYYSDEGLNLIREYVDKKKVRNIKILTSVFKVTPKFRENCKDLITQLKKEGIILSVNVLIDKSVLSQFHDRYIITKDHIFNVPSLDVIFRGQYSNVSEIQEYIPFDDWWNQSLDIVTEWAKIDAALSKINDQKKV